MELLSMVSLLLDLAMAVHSQCVAADEARKAVKRIGTQMSLVTGILKQIQTQVGTSNKTDGQQSNAQIITVYRGLSFTLKNMKEAIATASAMGAFQQFWRSRAINSDIEAHYRDLHFGISTLCAVLSLNSTGETLGKCDDVINDLNTAGSIVGGTSEIPTAVSTATVASTLTCSMDNATADGAILMGDAGVGRVLQRSVNCLMGEVGGGSLHIPRWGQEVAEYYGSLHSQPTIRQGWGCMKWDDGSSYNGEWKNNRPHGRGIFVNQFSVVYMGGFRAGNFHGTGAMHYKSELAYCGVWKDGYPHGYFEMKSQCSPNCFIEFHGALAGGAFSRIRWKGWVRIWYEQSVTVSKVEFPQKIVGYGILANGQSYFITYEGKVRGTPARPVYPHDLDGLGIVPVEHARFLQSLPKF